MKTTSNFETAPSNLDQRQAWDGSEGDYWAANAKRFDAAVARYHLRLMEAAGIAKDSKVLDIGCGTGQTTRDAARRASSGSALGVDLSARMLEVARLLAHQEGVTNADFVQADAQVHAFAPSSFDVAISRTGAMFFGDPAQAFANICQALVPGGRLTLLTWQPLPENEWFVAVSTALAAGRDIPAPPKDAPGPFALSDPDRVSGLLTGAGFEEPVFEDLREPMHLGSDADDAHRFMLGLAGWMLDGLDDGGRARAQEDLHATMRAHESAAGVTFGSAMWLVSTQHPGWPGR
jgi:SAM-dependent methyltransferase